MAMPANVTTVVVLGTFLTPEGNPSTGTVSFTPSSWLTNSGANVAIPNSTVTKTLGTAGNFTVTLPITDDPDLNPEGWVYSVSEVVDGVSQSYNIAIPGTVAAGGTVFLADLVPVAPAGPEYFSLASSLSIGTVSTLPAGSAATADITGLAPNQILDLGIPTGPQGVQGPAATIAVGTVTSVANSGTASVTNVGSSTAGTFNFVLRAGPTGPTGATGATGTLAVGSVSSVSNAGTASVTNVGSSTAGTFNFVLRDGPTGPQGATGPQGPAATIEVGTVTAGTAGGTPSVTNTGTSGSAVFDFVLIPGDTGPQGNTGATGSAATVTVGTVGFVDFPGPGTVINSGTSGSAVLDFILVRGPQGAIGDLTAAAPLRYVGSEFGLNVGVGLETSGTALAVTYGTASSALGSSAAGTANRASRQDHVHAMPTAANVGAVGTATQVIAGTALTGGGSLTANVTLNANLTSSAAAALAAAASAGTATTIARADHVHPFPTAANVGALGTGTLTSTNPAALAAAAAPGSSTNVARLDHVHPFPTAANVGAIATTALTSTNPAALGTAAAPGSSTNVARLDHVHARPTPADIGAIANSLVQNSKGALITSTGSAVAALTVGTNGHVLTADSAATNGIKWAAAASGADIDPLFLAGV